LAKDPKIEDTGSPWGYHDPSPLFLTPRAEKALSEEEYMEAFGPPYGPCGVSCNCLNCVAYRRELKESGPAGTPKHIPDRDQFGPLVEKVIASEYRAEWREAIRDSACFARMWYSEVDNSYCTEMDCPLRNICQYTWEKAQGGLVEKALNGEDTDDEENPSPKRKKSKSKIILVRKHGAIVKSSRIISRKMTMKMPYVDTGRPSDTYAKALWEYAGSPPQLTEVGYFNAEDVEKKSSNATNKFVERHGLGLFVTKNTSYHTYIFNGYPYMRLWMTAFNSCWLDCTKELSKHLFKNAKNAITAVPVKKTGTTYRWYPYRVYIYDMEGIDRVKVALKQCRGFEFLSLDQFS
jgi:hypothetical protein